MKSGTKTKTLMSFKILTKLITLYSYKRQDCPSGCFEKSVPFVHNCAEKTQGPEIWCSLGLQVCCLGFFHTSMHRATDSPQMIHRTVCGITAKGLCCFVQLLWKFHCRLHFIAPKLQMALAVPCSSAAHGGHCSNPGTALPSAGM